MVDIKEEEKNTKGKNMVPDFVMDDKRPSKLGKRCV